MTRSIQRVKVFRKQTAARGSVTVFASLTLLLVASFLLALLEAARVEGLESYADMNRVNAMESVFSGYNRELFEEYGVFLLDGGCGSGTLQLSEIGGRLLEVSQKNLRPSASGRVWKETQNFYQMDVRDAAVTHYLLATDYNGAPFRRMAAESMKFQFPIELARQVKDGFAAADRAMEQGARSRAALADAETDMEAARERQAQEQADTSPPGPLTVSGSEHVENPIEAVKKLKETDLLTLMLPEGSSVSAKAIVGADTLERRRLCQGNEPWRESGGWYETLCYQQFLKTHFSCYTSDEAGGGALDYELEYIQAGKSSDRENLKKVVQELLLLREGANFLYLQTDAAKKEEAYAAATALLAATGLAAAAPALAQGILAAWAFCESVVDVRTLLAGKKVPWMKTAESWSSSLSGLVTALTGGVQTGTQTEGEDYGGYLQKLLYLKSERILNYRAMDLLEQQLRQREGYTHVRMDAMVLFLRAEFIYEAQPLFSAMVTLRKLETDRFAYKGVAQYGYLSED